MAILENGMLAESNGPKHLGHVPVVGSKFKDKYQLGFCLNGLNEPNSSMVRDITN